METCSNCFKKTSQAYPFCPYCGYPNIDIGLRHCPNGHTIYETYKSCPFCGQMVYAEKSLIKQGPGVKVEETTTEILDPVTNIKNPDNKKETGLINEEPPGDKTVLETYTNGKTVLESDADDKTRLETMTAYPDKTIMEDEVDKTILDEKVQETLPPFFAWLVYIDEQGSPLHDVRLTRQKNVIGKGGEADIQLKDDFASKLHAAIYFEEGQFFISDLGSTNHTWLNEKKIMNEELKDGDNIRIGHQNMIFKRVRRNL